MTEVVPTIGLSETLSLMSISLITGVVFVVGFLKLIKK